MPNMIRPSFEKRVPTLFYGYIALEVCTALDLHNSTDLILKLKEKYPNKNLHSFISDVQSEYKKWRQQYSINHSSLIQSNVGGLLAYNKEYKCFEDWIDEDFGEDINEFVNTLNERSVNVKNTLNNIQKNLKSSFL